MHIEIDPQTSKLTAIALGSTEVKTTDLLKECTREEAAQLAAQWQSGTVEMFFHPAVPAAAQLQTQPQTPPVSRPARPAPTCARTKSWQSILAVMASM